MCRYMGGKGKIGKHVAERILEIEKKVPIDTDSYFEPFVGMCGIMRHIPDTKPKFACDYSTDIINLWTQVLKGWVPPSSMSREEFNFQKTQKSSALRCFAAHGASFGGVCFGSYIGDYNKGPEGIDTSSRSIIRVSKMVQDVIFLESRSYEEFSPEKSTIYCDPPYLTARRTILARDNFKNFDHGLFWEKMRTWVKNKNIVIVSEYTAPLDFEAVWERQVSLFAVQNKHKGHRTEKLFMHVSQSMYVS